MEHEWVKEFPSAVTVCDAKGIIVAMNDRSAETFTEEGGYGLIGKNLFDCHPEPSRSTLEELIKEQRSNIYTIENKGIKKMICQSPWYRAGEFAGLVEISIVLPENIPHFFRG